MLHGVIAPLQGSLETTGGKRAKTKDKGLEQAQPNYNGK